MGEQLIHDPPRHVDRNGEADADIAATPGEDCGVDADQLALEVDERTARVADIDGGIGLNEILVGVGAEPQPGAADGADDAGGDGLAEAEGVADGDDVVAHLQCVGVRERQRRQRICVDLEQRDIRLGVGAHQLRLERAAVGQGDGDLLRQFDHVIVGEQVAVLGVHDDAGAQRTGPPELRALALRHALTEEFLEERVIEEGMRLLRLRLHLLQLARGHDVHHGRTDLLHQGRERRYLVGR